MRAHLTRATIRRALTFAKYLMQCDALLAMDRSFLDFSYLQNDFFNNFLYEQFKIANEMRVRLQFNCDNKNPSVIVGFCLWFGALESLLCVFLLPFIFFICCIWGWWWPSVFVITASAIFQLRWKMEKNQRNCVLLECPSWFNSKLMLSLLFSWSISAMLF